MPDPTPEHLASLARVLDPANIKSRGYLAITPHEAAKALYAAVRTDPEVQDAMLAALAAGGRLVEELELSHCPWLRCERDLSGECLYEACRVVTRRRVRLVEPEWRDAQ